MRRRKKMLFAYFAVYICHLNLSFVASAVLRLTNPKWLERELKIDNSSPNYINPKVTIPSQYPKEKDHVKRVFMQAGKIFIYKLEFAQCVEVRFLS